MSMAIFMREFSQLYSGETLTPLNHQFKDYSEWMQTRDLQNQERYWLEVFHDDIPVLDLPLDYQRPQVQSNQGDVVIQTLGQTLSDEVREMAKKTGTTEYMIFLSVAMILLSKYGRQEDVVIGSPISGRTHKDTESMLGMFINTLAIRTQPEGEKSYISYLEEVKDICLKAYENQEYPYEELTEHVDVKRDVSRNPLFDVMLVLQNNDVGAIASCAVTAEHVTTTGNMAKFDLTFNIAEQNNIFSIALEYCTDLFMKTTAERLISHYLVVLSQLLKHPSMRIAEIEVVNAAEKQQIIHTFNAISADYPKEKTIVALSRNK